MSDKKIPYEPPERELLSATGEEGPIGEMEDGTPIFKYNPDPEIVSLFDGRMTVPAPPKDGE